MRSKVLLVTACLLSRAAAAQAQAFTEGFDNIATLPAAGWVQINNSDPLGATNWFQGRDALFPAQAGAPNAYIGADVDNTGDNGTISNWLLTPPAVLANGDTMTFFTRTLPITAFPDRLQVRMSTAGAGSDVGTTATSVGTFTTLLLDINPLYTTTDYPGSWTQFTATVSGLPSPTLGRLAFRYFVEDGGFLGNNSTYIGIDTVAFPGAPQADFSFSCNPAALTIAQGGNAPSACTVQSLNAFASAVDLSCSGLPAGVTCAFNPGSVTPPANGTVGSTLTVSVGGATPLGTYNFLAQGVSGALTHTFNMSVTVTAAADFSLSCNPAALTIAPGGNGTSACAVQSLNAFASAVDLSCSGLPAGVTCAFNPASVTPPANGVVSSTLTVSVGGATPPGTYNFQAHGVSGALTRTFNLSVTVNSQSVAPLALAVDAAGNGVFQPNETVVMAPTWRNTGLGAIALTGSLGGHTGPPGPTYDIPDANADYGTIAAAGQNSCTGTGNCYSVRNSNVVTRPLTHWDDQVTETVTPTGTTKNWILHIGDSFTDVPPSSGFYRFIETILHKNVTGGCTSTAYCPAASTTREQMAVFVLVAKEPAGYVPVACGATPMFPDVPVTSGFCRWVEELARRGVVGGCGGGLYCPTASATREQMAVFVLRTLDPTLNPPACGTPVFADVPATSGFCRWIEELVRRGVVTGCGGGNYCPTASVNREQMGVFLSVTFGLTLYGL